MITLTVTFKCPVVNCPNNKTPVVLTTSVQPGQRVVIEPPTGWHSLTSGDVGDAYCPRHQFLVQTQPGK
jgi:hypothetical protein